MFRIFDLSNRKKIAEVSNEHISFLTSYLEEEDSVDVDYYLDKDTLDYLKTEAQKNIEPNQDIEEFLAILESTLGNRDSMYIAYDEIEPYAEYSVTGRIVDKQHNPISGLKVEAWDIDLLLDDNLGWCFTDNQGRFTITYEDSDFSDLGLDIVPEFMLIIKEWQQEHFEIIKEVNFQSEVTGADDFGNIEI